MSMFTLLDIVEIQLFYKVVNIIQEHVLPYYYYNHYINIPSHHSKLRCFKDTPKQTLLTKYALKRLIKPQLKLGLNNNTYFGSAQKSEKITVTYYHLTKHATKIPLHSDY
jgi:hypothetical protein